MQFEEFKGLLRSFFERLQSKISTHNIRIEPHWDIDHVCYRTQSQSEYAQMKEAFSTFAHLLIESEVNGRPISTFQLKEPAWFLNRRIDLVELPAPKPDKATPSGFEHIEIVCDENLSALQDQMVANNLKVEARGLQKDFNQELEVTLGVENIKFHNLSLKSVIELEKNKNAFSALQKSKILSAFKKFDPLVVGTLPLAISNKKSDLDIIVQSRQLNEIEDILNQNPFWGVRHKKRIRVNELESLVASFEFEGVPFELFAQSRATTKQMAYRHFFIEEKLLKYKGPQFKERILDLRRQGLKTEPAFAVALGFEGDPYRSLLSLEKTPPQELLTLP